MKHKRRKTHSSPSKRALKLAALSGAGLGLAWGVQADTILTFDGFSVNNTPIGTLPGYGDNVIENSPDYTVSPGFGGIIGTPDIALDWIGTWDTYTGWDGRGSVAQSDFNGGPIVSILFTPSASSAVRLLSFELDEWAGGGDGSITWSLTGASSGLLNSGTWTMAGTGGRTTIRTGLSGAIGEAVTLSLQLNTGSGSYFALDNLTFAQVPEPSSLALGAAGALVAVGAAAMRRRRRSC